VFNWNDLRHFLAFGGPELNLVDYIRVIEELARADGSAAWCATVAACYSRIAGYLQPEVAREIFGSGRTVVAGTINPVGKACAVDGGYRVTGRWAYGSGILHSTWTLGNCIAHDHEGPRRASRAGPDIRMMIFPTSAVEVIDTWHVSGLRGTGSHDYRVADLFVRDDHSISGFDAKPLQPGTLYAIPMITVLSVAIAAVPLGIARTSIDAAVELAQVKTPCCTKAADWSAASVTFMPVPSISPRQRTATRRAGASCSGSTLDDRNSEPDGGIGRRPASNRSRPLCDWGRRGEWSCLARPERPLLRAAALNERRA
jgi:alkylation response protein AidB-like acyl-CoA dehydrogenase